MRTMSASKCRLTWGTSGSYPQAMADPEEEETTVEEKKGMRRLRWADCDDNEEEGRLEEQEAEREGEKEGER